MKITRNPTAKAMLEGLFKSRRSWKVLGGRERRLAIEEAIGFAIFKALSAPVVETQGETFKTFCPVCGGTRNRSTCPRCHGKGTLTVVEVVRKEESK